MSVCERKILLIAPDPDMPGGIAKWVKHIKTKNEDHQLIHFLLTPKSYFKLERSFLERCIHGSITYLYIVFKTIYLLCDSRKKISVVHLTTSASISLLKDLMICFLSKLFKVKFIIHYHFGRIPSIEFSNNWEWKLLKYISKHSDVVITMDEKSYNVLISKGLKNIYNIPNPYPCSFLDFEGKYIHEHRVCDILFVGQMIETKGIFELLDVCTQLDNIHLCMYGAINSSVRDEIRLRFGDSNEKFTIGGEIQYEEIIIKMRGSSLFVLPTYTEGFPNVILEAMACGCPIIASSVGAIPEMLAIDSAEPCGICIPPKDTVALKNAITFLLENPLIASEMGNRARKRVSSEYSIDKVWSQLETVWNK